MDELLGAPSQDGRSFSQSDSAPGRGLWLRTYNFQTEEDVVVIFADDGSTTVATPSDLGVPLGASLHRPFVGVTGAVVASFVEDLNIAGLNVYWPDGDLRCATESSALFWQFGAELVGGDWALLGVSFGAEEGVVGYIGDPCEASAETPFSIENLSSTVHFEYADGRFVVTSVEKGESVVRTYDEDGIELISWSSAGDPRVAAGWWTGLEPGGRMLLTDDYEPALNDNTIVLAYVDLDNGAGEVREYPGLWNDYDPPSVVVEFDVADTPWMIFGQRDLRISPLPTEDGEPCCPTISEVWVREGLKSSRAFYAVPDGVIAATSAVPDDGGPEDIIVTRFRFAR